MMNNLISMQLVLLLCSFTNTVKNTSNIKTTNECDHDICSNKEIFKVKNFKSTFSNHLVDEKKEQNVELLKENYLKINNDLEILTDSNLKNSKYLLNFNESVVDSDVGRTNDINGTLQDIDFSTTAATIDLTQKSRNKLNASITKSATLEFQFFQNQSKGICFCDLTFNQCDINCCCDKECNTAHFSVFTKCIDVQFEGDEMYCFKNNFILKNNTSYKMVASHGGLLCIIKDNFQCSLKYKTKPIIKNLESFNKELDTNFYSFTNKVVRKLQFTNLKYRAGSFVWVVLNGEIKTLEMPAPMVGFLCTSHQQLHYLIDYKTKCMMLNELQCEGLKEKNVIYYLKNVKIISNPEIVNQSKDNEKICQSSECLQTNFFLCGFSFNSSCVKVSKSISNQLDVECLNRFSKIHLQIWHNGSEGIKKLEAYLWLKNSSEEVGQYFLQTIEVKFFWEGHSNKVFKKSGNPGYITGEAVPSGRKVYITNGTTEKKEAIELSYDSAKWLTVLGSRKGVCSSKKRIPVNFRENAQYVCLFKFTKTFFSKDKCKDLQNIIFEFLLGSDIVNVTNLNNFNKFVATFGNSKIEETEDWVKVLIDLFPVISSQAAFKSSYNYLMCKNIITDLFIYVIFAKIGSFMHPQSKILGVSYQFGEHKDLTFYCSTHGCENTTFIPSTFLSTAVHFVDISEPATDAFADPLKIETKLPHDFFYPFFSKSCLCSSSNVYIFVLIIAVLLI